MARTEVPEERGAATGSSDPAPAPTTRDRLIRAAIDIANIEGIAAVTTVNVTKRAGIAQSSYYTHFSSRDELLEAIGAIGARHSRRLNHETRLRYRDDPADPERQRDLYRVPLADMRAHPDLFRLQLRARTEPPDSTLGRAGHEAADSARRSLADDLVARGEPGDAEGVRRRYEMLADCITAMVEQLGLGAVEGRYPDDEELVDLLILLTRGNRDLAEWLSWRADPLDPAPRRTPSPD